MYETCKRKNETERKSTLFNIMSGKNIGWDPLLPVKALVLLLCNRTGNLIIDLSSDGLINPNRSGFVTEKLVSEKTSIIHEHIYPHAYEIKPETCGS